MTTASASASPALTAPIGSECSEFDCLSMSRRSLLKASAVSAGAAAMFGTSFVDTPAWSATPAESVLVVLSLRGAADGLSLVVPHGDPVYYSARPNTAIPKDRLLGIDSLFGLHPKLAPLLPWWQNGTMAAVHATGLPARNRSHFAAMEEIEDADPGSVERVGWLNRLIGAEGSESPLEAINMGQTMTPTSTFGPQPTLTMQRVKDGTIAGADPADTTQWRRRSLTKAWEGSTSPMAAMVRNTFKAVEQFSPALAQQDNSASYPNHDLGRALAHAARVIRADIGAKVVTVDHGGWDMHASLGTLEWGSMLGRAGELASGLAAFLGDLGPAASKTTVVVLSEFGRRVAENASYGLDHGYGNAMLLFGAGVRGGKVYGSWPGLSGGVDDDLLVTTDYRSVLSEVVASRFGADATAVFPGFAREAVGVMA